MQKYNDAVAEFKRLGDIQSGLKNTQTDTAMNRYKKLEELEKVTIPYLELHKNDIAISETCRSYLEKWIKEQPEFYGRTKEFTSKYTEKGNLCEDDAIQFCADTYGWGMVAKNQIRYEQDEEIEGTPDIVLTRSVQDTKVCWDYDTFPLFDECRTNVTNGRGMAIRL